MKQNILVIKSGAIALRKPLIQPLFCRVGKNFSGARMSLLNPARGPESHIQRVTTNITNNLKTVNHISVRVMIRQNARMKENRAGAVWGSVGAAAQAIIDGALQREIDRELTLMERGENIGSNQRRLNRMRAYLNAKPYHVVRNFYAVHMHNPTHAESASATAGEPFYTDIVREKSVRDTRSVSEIHLNAESAAQPQPDGCRGVDAKKIAGQILEQVEKRMRLDQERRGIWP
ncbi:hypothetical protein [Caproicibacter sp.]|uniref:hypothetical protein n=1 Tax=Caproicibacter sp. TaxID=2814884 RepID=UPI00398939BB